MTSTEFHFKKGHMQGSSLWVFCIVTGSGSFSGEGTTQPYGILEPKVQGSENLTGTLYRKSVLQRLILASGF